LTGPVKKSNPTRSEVNAAIQHLETTVDPLMLFGSWPVLAIMKHKKQCTTALLQRPNDNEHSLRLLLPLLRSNRAIFFQYFLQATGKKERCLRFSLLQFLLCLLNFIAC
jgi:hypothetical protein